MDDDVVAISRDVHGREEVRAMQQECVAQASNSACCHLEGGHCCSVVPPLHWNLCNKRHVSVQGTVPGHLSFWGW